jgi:hypothetical protein
VKKENSLLVNQAARKLAFFAIYCELLTMIESAELLGAFSFWPERLLYLIHLPASTNFASLRAKEKDAVEVFLSAVNQGERLSENILFPFFSSSTLCHANLEKEVVRKRF